MDYFQRLVLEQGLDELLFEEMSLRAVRYARLLQLTDVAEDDVDILCQVNRDLNLDLFYDEVVAETLHRMKVERVLSGRPSR